MSVGSSVKPKYKRGANNSGNLYQGIASAFFMKYET